MRMWTSQDGGLERSGQTNVVAVLGATAEQQRILQTRHILRYVAWLTDRQISR
jgi:hypothetical protein